jgi:agmatine deiminase
LTPTTPAAAGFRQPAEWTPHAATWLAFPSHADLWCEALPDARAEWTALARAIAWAPPGATPERLEVCVPFADAEEAARAAVDGLDARLHRVSFGDIWLRDIAPVFLVDGAGRVGSVRFRFNGWGGKYVLDHDADVAARIQALDGRTAFALDRVLEGGSVDVDGEGTLLTTRQCLLNANRGDGDVAAIEADLRAALGVEAVLWLGDGLLNDHTDGHVDTLARFVAPGVVCCMAPSGADDPNRAVLDDLARQLGALRDARGRRLEVVRVPSPGLVTDETGRVMPASYVNFYIANHTVVVPTYGTPHDDAAVEAIGRLFPGRRAVGVSARAILEGGGAFHCITQQVPAGGAR